MYNEYASKDVKEEKRLMSMIEVSSLIIALYYM